MKTRFLVVLLLLGLPAAAQVSGVVLDQATMQPIPGALVSVQLAGQRTETASDGTFSLPGATGTGLVVVAAAKGYYNQGLTLSTPASSVIFQLEPVPVANDPGYVFVDPTTCGSCHPDQYAQWAVSAMAHAGTNTWVYDIYDGTGTPGGMGGFVYTLTSPHAASNPNSECAACHQPEPWIMSPGSALEPINNLSIEALRGVSCETCHKIADIDETKVNFPGIHASSVTFNRPSNPSTDTVQYGVLGDTSFHSPGFMRPSYQPQLTSEVCAACHQDKNDPDGNGNFEEPNGVISEPTYLEWKNSPYGDPNSPLYASCVDCHMPAYGATSLSPFGLTGRDPNRIRHHDMEGSSAEFLENAVDLTMNASRGATDLLVTVAITNSHTGHHVPTGVTIRNMILLVEAWDVETGVKLVHTGSQVVDDLGGIGDPAQGYYAGLPGKLFAKKNHDANGNGPTFFTDATGILWDNRIPALATDVTNYTFQVPPGTGPVTVRARLIYRRSFRFLVDAKQWTTDGHGNPLEDIQPPYFGHLMEEAVWTSGGPGAVATYGTGCANLQAGWQGLPFMGSSDFKLTLNGGLPNQQALLLGGFSDTNWLGTPLPLDMAAYGAPGCWLLTSVDGFVPGTTDANGHAEVPLGLPFVPGFVGTHAYFQWAVDGYANPLGWSFSNGLRLILQP